MKFISRADAETMLRDRHECVDGFDRRRNYEIEDDLIESTGFDWCISDWCPFNGRFCRLQEWAPLPHPYMNGERRDKDSTEVSETWKLPTAAELQQLFDDAITFGKDSNIPVDLSILINGIRVGECGGTADEIEAYVQAASKASGMKMEWYWRGKKANIHVIGNPHDARDLLYEIEQSKEFELTRLQ